MNERSIFFFRGTTYPVRFKRPVQFDPLAMSLKKVQGMNRCFFTCRRTSNKAGGLYDLPGILDSKHPESYYLIQGYDR